MAKPKVKGNRKEMSQAFYDKSEQELNTLRASVAGTLKNDILRLLEEELHTDLLFTNGVDSVKAHKSILWCRARHLWRNEWLTRPDDQDLDCDTIHLHGVNAAQLQSFVRQLYTVSDAVLLLEEFLPFLPSPASSQKSTDKGTIVDTSFDSSSLTRDQTDISCLCPEENTASHVAGDYSHSYQNLNCQIELAKAAETQKTTELSDVEGKPSENKSLVFCVSKPAEQNALTLKTEDSHGGNKICAEHEPEESHKTNPSNLKSNDLTRCIDDQSDVVDCPVKVSCRKGGGFNGEMCNKDKQNNDLVKVGKHCSEHKDGSIPKTERDYCEHVQYFVRPRDKENKEMLQNGTLTNSELNSVKQNESHVFESNNVQSLNLEAEENFTSHSHCFDCDDTSEMHSDGKETFNSNSPHPNVKIESFSSVKIPHETCSPIGSDLLILYFNQYNSDCCLVVKGKKFPAHKCVLSARSEYFEAMLGGQWSESLLTEITLEGVSATAVQHLLLFLYGGLVTLPIDDASMDLLDLFLVADMYGVSSLNKVLSFYLRRDLCHFFHKPCQICILTAGDALSLCHNFNLEELEQRCLKWIGKNFSKIWPSKTFAGLPEKLHQICLKWITNEFTPGNVLDIIVECNRLTVSLPRVKWTEGILCLLTQLMDSAIEFTSTNFVQVIQTPGFLRWARVATWKAGALEEIFITVIDSLPIAAACNAFQALLKLQASCAVEPDEAGPDENSYPNEEVTELLKTLVQRCERFLRTHIHQIMRSSQWSELPKPVQTRIMETSAYLSLSDLPEPKPRIGARKHVNTKPLMQARPRPEVRGVRARGTSQAESTGGTSSNVASRAAGNTAQRSVNSQNNAPAGRRQPGGKQLQDPNANRIPDAHMANTRAAARANVQARPSTSSQKAVKSKVCPSRDTQVRTKSETKNFAENNCPENQGNTSGESSHPDNQEETPGESSNIPNASDENSQKQYCEDALSGEAESSELESKVGSTFETATESSLLLEDSVIQADMQGANVGTSSGFMQKKNLSGTQLNTGTCSNHTTRRSLSHESSPGQPSSRLPVASGSSLSRSPRQRWSSGSGDSSGSLHELSGSLVSAERDHELDRASTEISRSLSLPARQVLEEERSEVIVTRDAQESSFSGEIRPEVKVVKMSRPLSIGFVIPPN
ncbi:BTB/POZ domain-containing protein 8 [Plakobranchus ocellatus]|uniref:BTB/POZ domain-containing protein 8 n=1 Tax=Plakobranchus ocellatus TaxID=259542 RepID=A0AAV4BB42_9GAST|nr:BTB/POZ domain-containing protein 8 [Plakobranchus ocellatus]